MVGWYILSNKNYSSKVQVRVYDRKLVWNVSSLLKIIILPGNKRQSLY